MPAGERRPQAIGSHEPSKPIENVNPRQSARPKGSPPKGLFIVIHMRPSGPMRGPKLYSW